VHIGDFMSKLHSLAVPMGDIGAATGMATFCLKCLKTFFLVVTTK
jgi:hypothetical protein